MTMMDLAHHIIAVAHKNNIPVTNLQLQKVMFFSLKDAISEKLLPPKVIKETYDQPFLVWRYGPVEKDVYEEYKIYGSDPIIEPCQTSDIFEELNKKIVQFLKEPPFELVRKSHQESFWKKNEDKIVGWRSNVSYSLTDIKNG